MTNMWIFNTILIPVHL